MKPDSVILIINSSPKRSNSHTQVLLDAAVRGVASAGDCRILTYHFAGKRFSDCNAVCRAYCAAHGSCIQKDDLEELLPLWQQADGYIIGAPVYHMGLPAQLKAALDRLGNINFASMQGQYPRFLKVGGAIAQGGVRYGGQELAIQQVVSHLMLLNCLPVSGDMPESYMGVATYTTSLEQIRADQVALDSAFSLGFRLAQLTKIVQSGRAALAEQLGKDYFPEYVQAEAAGSADRA